MKRLTLAASLAALSWGASAVPAGAAVTIGQLAANAIAGGGGTGYSWTQPTVTSGNSYVVQGAGTITSWSHRAVSAPSQQLKLKIFRPAAGFDFTYTVVGQDGPRNLTSGALNEFPTSIAVKAGDVLGLYSVAGDPGVVSIVPGETNYTALGDHPDGALVTFTPNAERRLNASAVIMPTNTFSFGATTRNKKKGTATLTLELPGPGELAVSGKGVREASAAGVGATTAKGVPAAGKVELTIKAKGNKKRKLNETGKVKVKPKITYTPTGGSPSTQPRKLKLNKR